MPRFRKKPVEIEAIRVPPIQNINERVVLDKWLLERQGDRTCRYVGKKIEIPTFEGIMTAQEGDWIIQGVQSELYQCKPDIFQATYDPA